MYRLYDASVWIEYKQGANSTRVDQLDLDLILNEVCICPVIMQEVLQGIRLDNDFADLKRDFKRLNLLDWDATEAAISAAALYRQLRKRGITIRKPNDCLIAAYALHFNVELCHNDRDFDQIAEHTILKVWEG